MARKILRTSLFALAMGLASTAVATHTGFAQPGEDEPSAESEAPPEEGGAPAEAAPLVAPATPPAPAEVEPAEDKPAEEAELADQEEPAAGDGASEDGSANEMSDLGDDPMSSGTWARRKTASGVYAYPSLIFIVHGYATLGFAVPGEELGTELGATPQILVSGISPRVGKNRGGFRNDAAVFIGGESGRVSSAIELHFVGTGLDPVMTEAKLGYALLNQDDSDSVGLRIIGGRYWWPFGAHDQEWFSQANAFSLVSSAAAEVVPAHVNTVGVAIEGEYQGKGGVGVNGIVSVGNGAPSFELGDNVFNTPFDFDGNRSITGRFAFLLHGDLNLDLGMSFSTMRLRAGEDATFDELDARRYAATMLALGPDLNASWNGLGLRAYYYMSSEDFDEAAGPMAIDKLERAGFTAEPSYQLDVGNKYIDAIKVVARYSQAEEDRMDGGVFVRNQMGAALHLITSDSLTFKAGYLLQGEAEDAPEADNDVAQLSITGNF